MTETEPLLGALHTNVGVSCLALLITAIVETSKNQLSLFHAIFIWHILFLFGISASPVGVSDFISFASLLNHLDNRTIPLHQFQSVYPGFRLGSRVYWHYSLVSESLASYRDFWFGSRM